MNWKQTTAAILVVLLAIGFAVIIILPLLVRDMKTIWAFWL